MCQSYVYQGTEHTVIPLSSTERLQHQYGQFLRNRLTLLGSEHQPIRLDSTHYSDQGTVLDKYQVGQTIDVFT